MMAKTGTGTGPGPDVNRIGTIRMHWPRPHQKRGFAKGARGWYVPGPCLPPCLHGGATLLGKLLLLAPSRIRDASKLSKPSSHSPTVKFNLTLDCPTLRYYFSFTLIVVTLNCPHKQCPDQCPDQCPGRARYSSQVVPWWASQVVVKPHQPANPRMPTHECSR